MRHLALLALAVLAVTAQGATLDALPANATLLFTQQADKAIIAQGPSGNLTMRLEGVKKFTTWFADRPDRLAGVLLTIEFASNFGIAFGTNPPNAALVGTVDGRSVSIVVEVDEPMVDGNDLVYAVKATEPKTPIFGPLFATAESLNVEEVELEEATMLIDDVGPRGLTGVVT